MMKFIFFISQRGINREAGPRIAGRVRVVLVLGSARSEYARTLEKILTRDAKRMQKDEKGVCTRTFFLLFFL